MLYPTFFKAILVDFVYLWVYTTTALYIDFPYKLMSLLATLF